MQHEGVERELETDDSVAAAGVITGGGGAWEIEEVASEDGASESRPGTLLAGRREERRDCNGCADGEDVYVAVGKGGSGMDALGWALKQKPTGFVYLVHVFPVVHHIPTPLGMLPKNQVSPQQVESHMSEERMKRRQLLQKYFKLCDDSKVKVDTLLIESDSVADAILELIPVLHIGKLIMGTSRSNMRSVRKGSWKMGQVVKNAPEYCEIKVICEGREVRTAANATPPSPSSPANAKEDNKGGGKSPDRDRNTGKASCRCFSRKFMHIL